MSMQTARAFSLTTTTRVFPGRAAFA